MVTNKKKLKSTEVKCDSIQIPESTVMIHVSTLEDFRKVLLKNDKVMVLGSKQYLILPSEVYIHDTRGKS